MKKTIILVVVFLLLSLSLLGCSDSPTEEIQPSVTASSIPVTPSPAPTDTAAPLPTNTASPVTEPLEEEEQAIQYGEPGDYLDSMVVDGLERWFVVHLPPQYDPEIPVPLVLGLHGRTSNTFVMRDASQLNAKADEEGFIVVYPQALGKPPTWFGVLFGETGEPDMNFFRELIPYLQSQVAVDPVRIYATGISNGGTMVNRLGCEMSEVFAAIAPVAGAHSGLHLCDPEEPISVLAIHGTDDPIIPFDGAGANYPSVPEWVWGWADRNNCQGEPMRQLAYENVILESFDECDAGTSVALYTIEGGGHTWLALVPGSAVTGFVPEVSATDVIWDFFKAHPKNPGS